MGVAGRTLFKHFRDARGASPMQYLRNARFEKVHAALLCAEESDNVAAIGLRWALATLDVSPSGIASAMANLRHRH